MSKRYPPISNVILFAVAVCVILANPMIMLMPLISTVTNFIAFAVSSILYAVGYAYDHYTIFALHVVIIALYAKQLFGKDARTHYQTAMDTFESYNNHTCDRTEATITLGHHFKPLYAYTCSVLSLIVFNIVYPNFYHFTILELLHGACNDIIDSNLVLSSSPIIVFILIMIPIVIGDSLAEIKTYAMVGEGCVSAAYKQMNDID